MGQVARVNAWLLHPDRLKAGRHHLPDILRQIEEIDTVAETELERWMCVSMCGSPQEALDARVTLGTTRLRGRVELEQSGAFVNTQRSVAESLLEYTST